MGLIKKVRRVSVILLVISFVFWDTDLRTHAQADQEHEDLAKKIVDLLREEAFLERQFNLAIRMTSPEHQEDSEAVLSRLDLNEIYAGMTEAIAEGYTSEELRAYLEFASTEAGRSILRKQAEFDVVMQELATLAVLKAIAGE